MAYWMELPNYPLSTFRQQRRNSKLTLRATYEEMRAYYIHYVKRHRLIDFFRNGCEVTSIERIHPNTNDVLWEVRGHRIQDNSQFMIHAKYIVLASGMSHSTTRLLNIPNEKHTQSFTFTTYSEIENLIIEKQSLTSESKPLLIIGCGLTAVDVLLLCQQYSIPVLHVFRRSIDDYDLILNQLPASLYPEYERIKDSMKTSCQIRSWSYQCFPQSEIISLNENHSIQIRNLRTQTTNEFEISFIARLTGTDIDLPFFSPFDRTKSTELDLNPYTYECLHFENVYAIGALAGDRLVRFLQGGAFACAGNLMKTFFNHSQKTTKK